jgi:hypothetical protein
LLHSAEKAWQGETRRLVGTRKSQVPQIKGLIENSSNFLSFRSYHISKMRNGMGQTSNSLENIDMIEKSKISEMGGA